MIREILFGSAGWEQAKSALDAGAARQRVIASNIANASTPGYHAKEVLFEELLEGARGSVPMARTNPAHLRSSKSLAVPNPVIRERGGEAEASGVNDVSVEREMSEMAENTLHFQVLSQMLANKYQAVKNAIRTGA